MVSFVIVSHSKKLAEGVIDLAKMSAPDAIMYPAGGLENGDYGTSFDLITNAINSAENDDGVIVLMDMGSALMTTEMVLEALDNPKVVMVDCPIVAGAVAGTVLAATGASLEEITEELKSL